MSEVATKEERKINAVVPNRRQLAEHGRQTHIITVEDASHPEDFLDPAFWALVAKDMQLGDHVEIRDDGMTFWGEYLILAADKTWAKLHKLRESKLVPVEERSISPDYSVQYKGPHKKYCVVRKSDSSIVHEGAPDRASANVWLEGYARTVGAPVVKKAA